MTDKPTFDAGAHAQVKGFYDREYYGGHALARPSWHLRRIARRLRLRAGMRVLDVACGDGAWLQLLAAAGAEPHGVDISSVAVGRCRERLPGADIREAIAESLPHADAGFDLVTCMGSLEHFLDKPAALAEMRRVARPDARFLLLVPHAGLLTRRLGLYRAPKQPGSARRATLAEWNVCCARGTHDRRRWGDCIAEVQGYPRNPFVAVSLGSPALAHAPGLHI